MAERELQLEFLAHDMLAERMRRLSGCLVRYEVVSRTEVAGPGAVYACFSLKQDADWDVQVAVLDAVIRRFVGAIHKTIGERRLEDDKAYTVHITGPQVWDMLDTLRFSMRLWVVSE